MKTVLGSLLSAVLYSSLLSLLLFAACGDDDSFDASVDGSTDTIPGSDADLGVADAVPDTTPDAVLNECGGTELLEDGLGDPCGTCMLGSVVCDGQDALRCEELSPLPELNACGGCGMLDAVVGEGCGQCGGGVVVCDGTEATQCDATDDPVNDCGGCAVLENPKDAPCGKCMGGKYLCDGVDATTCDTSTDVINACGGCATLTAAPMDACGTCNGGVVACDGEEAIQCNGSENLVNACGGCMELTAAPQSACGPCGLDQVACDGKEAVACDGQTQCTDGAPCVDNDDCDQRYCSFGHCAPTGFSYVPSGTYTRGAPLDEPLRHLQRENGQHTVTLTRNILVQQTAVTQGNWMAMFGTSPAYFTGCGTNCPQEMVNWFEMLEFANRVSVARGFDACYTLADCVGTLNTGCSGSAACSGWFCDQSVIEPSLDCNGFRLPTEAEWEYFARAGTNTAYITASGTHSIPFAINGLDPEMDAIAWHGANSNVNYSPSIDCSSIVAGTSMTCGVHPVGQKAPNAWGLFDITGNVWEWVFDRSEDSAGVPASGYPAPGATVVDPIGPVMGIQRRMRGGNYAAGGRFVRVAYRTGPRPQFRYPDIGFRLVRTVQ